MNGAIESLVKITKRTLKAIVKDRVFTDEALNTFLTEVESVVNSRPITTISDDVNDYEALTPNHFLIGRNSPNINVTSADPTKTNLKTKWKAVQAATDMFWKRWVLEYLPTITEGRKWL